MSGGTIFLFCTLSWRLWGDWGELSKSWDASGCNKQTEICERPVLVKLGRGDDFWLLTEFTQLIKYFPSPHSRPCPRLPSTRNMISWGTCPCCKTCWYSAPCQALDSFSTVLLASGQGLPSIWADGWLRQSCCLKAAVTRDNEGMSVTCMYTRQRRQFPFWLTRWAIS